MKTVSYFILEYNSILKSWNASYNFAEINAIIVRSVWL